MHMLKHGFLLIEHRQREIRNGIIGRRCVIRVDVI